jgi:hypothetical protein
MGFDSYNRSLKIQESFGTPIPQVGVALGVWRFILSHFPSLPRVQDVPPMSLSCLALLQALVLVASPRLGLRYLVLFSSITFITLEIGWWFDLEAFPFTKYWKTFNLLHVLPPFVM